MKKLIIFIFAFILLANPILADQATVADSIGVSAAFIQKMYRTIREYEESDSIKTEKIKVQQDIILTQEQLIEELHKKAEIDSMRVDLYKEKLELSKPPFYESKTAFFIYGFTLVLVSSWIVNNVTNVELD